MNVRHLVRDWNVERSDRMLALMEWSTQRDALVAAVRTGNVEIVDRNLAHPAIDKFMLKNALEAAAHAGHVEIVDHILAYTAIDKDTLWYVLSTAAHAGHVEIVVRILAVIDGYVLWRLAAKETVKISDRRGHTELASLIRQELRVAEVRVIYASKLDLPRDIVRKIHSKM
ncbi:hypothetical protein TSOC_011028 [Tetrabaena socialis]|uniref:Ankyrin repeat domain-containing protein n=1 Tax=Tetrabaena socialis TaxID=47790 RepID=A0A2J7ZLR4_9CHLO|nr:hypothetical protein TSOC_012926 [Tetrabaena socialis]PNH02961.1 hypothetical protein TSOC_011028 [Tetrabaena socialis]|eukprot:PNH01202.1 hypothetical protein TSOC_012926 [Tetrabaena socialis]